MIFKQKGFTLLELLAVLSVLSILLFLVVPISFKKINQAEENKFLEVFMHDVLYTQNLAMDSPSDYVRLRIKDNHYAILRGHLNNTILKREFPKNWSFNTRNINHISFTASGAIREAGTIELSTPHSSYRIVCPPGKGRCYIVQQ